MPAASIAKPAEAMSDRIIVERRDGRTMFTWRWHLPLTLITTVIQATAFGIMFALWASTDRVLILGVAFAIGIASAAIERLCSRCIAKRERLEVGPDGIRISRGWRGKRMGDAIPLDRIMGAKPLGGPFGTRSVLIMVPGHHGGFAVPRLPTREDAQWLADAVEAELAVREHAV